jgi:GDP-L-fucose synthase
MSRVRTFVAGHRGLVGSAIVRALSRVDSAELVLCARDGLDLTDQRAVDRFFAANSIDHVYLAAARVGGILANSTLPAEFLYENLAIQTNVIHSAHAHGVKKLLFLGSSCIYPRDAPQPIREEHFLTGPFEPTNEAYAIAKAAGIKMCQAYRAQYGFDAISLMPTNIYGPRDNFDAQTSHVLPALLRRFHDARIARAEEVVVWGSGNPRREFLHADDLAAACVFAMHAYSGGDFMNVGTGNDIRIAELAELIARTVGFDGRIVFDTSKPDGMPRKLLNVDRLSELGWSASISLENGVRSTYEWLLDNETEARR